MSLFPDLETGQWLSHLAGSQSQDMVRLGLTAQPPHRSICISRRPAPRLCPLPCHLHSGVGLSSRQLLRETGKRDHSSNVGGHRPSGGGTRWQQPHPPASVMGSPQVSTSWLPGGGGGEPAGSEVLLTAFRLPPPQQPAGGSAGTRGPPHSRALAALGPALCLFTAAHPGWRQRARGLHLDDPPRVPCTISTTRAVSLPASSGQACGPASPPPLRVIVPEIAPLVPRGLGCPLENPAWFFSGGLGLSARVADRLPCVPHLSVLQVCGVPTPLAWPGVAMRTP